MSETISLHTAFLECNNVSIDTRTIEPGALYFAIVGDNFDGNLFADEALEKGAIYVVIDNPKYKKDERYVVVENTLLALQNLALFHRKHFSIPLLAITGSNGKTTTKELVYHVLKEKYNPLATKGNLNNHIGVPLTLLNLRKEHTHAIIEMGDNQRGDIQLLSQIVEPTHVIITNVGKDHLAGYKNQEENYQTKLELFEYASAHSTVAFVNKSDERLIRESVGCKCILYDPSDYIMHLNEAMQLEYKYNDHVVKTQLYGKYNIENIACAHVVGKYFAVPNTLIDKAVSEYVPELMRSQVQQTIKNKIILDAYNANPSSMETSLYSFNEIVGDKVAILGDMLELGESSVEEHQKIFELVHKLKIKTYFYGTEFCKISSEQSCFDSFEALSTHLQAEPIQNKIVFLKASRGMKAERFLELL